MLCQLLEWGKRFKPHGHVLPGPRASVGLGLSLYGISMKKYRPPTPKTAQPPTTNCWPSAVKARMKAVGIRCRRERICSRMQLCIFWSFLLLWSSARLWAILLLLLLTLRQATNLKLLKSAAIFAFIFCCEDYCLPVVVSVKRKMKDSGVLGM